MKDSPITTVVHISETVNILKNGMPQVMLSQTILGLFMLGNVKILAVTKDAYFAAVEIGEDYKLELNDALAVDLMRQNGVEDIYKNHR
jgi:predicted nucleic acid-binding protein